MPRVKGRVLSKEERKNLILTAGLKTFCRMGYDGANIEDIAKAANCSHGLIYYYFNNKEEIFRELIELAKKNADNVMTIFQNNENKTPSQLLYDLITHFLHTLESNDRLFHFFQFGFLLKLLKKDFVQLDIDEPKYVPYDELKKLFQAGLDSGEFKSASADECVILFSSLINGLSSTKAFLKDVDYPTFRIPSADYIYNIFVKKI